MLALFICAPTGTVTPSQTPHVAAYLMECPMSDDTKDQAAEGKQMTAAEAAKRVKRPVTEIEERKDREGHVVKVPRTSAWPSMPMKF